METNEKNAIKANDSKGYKIIFEKEKALEILHSILCNGALECFSNYGFYLTYDKKEYQEAKVKLEKDIILHLGNSVCYEDVLIQIVRNGGELEFEDNEGEGDNTKKLNVGVLLEGLSSASLENVFCIINGEDDAITGETVLQEILFGEILFG